MSGFPQLVNWVYTWFPVFALVLARTVAMVNTAPLIGQRTFPNQVRVSLAITLAACYTIAFRPEAPPAVYSWIFGVHLVGEILVGLLFAYAMNVIMLAIQAAGEIMDVQMGLSMIMLLNPAMRIQSTAMGRFFFQLATLIFVMTGSHLLMLAAFFHSFDLIPIGMARWHDAILPVALTQISVNIFKVGVQLAMPIMVVIFVVDFGLGIMNRVSPQINVLEMNQFLKPLTGDLILVLLLPTLIHMIASFDDYMIKSANDAMKAIAGPPSVVAPRLPKGPPPGGKPGVKIP